jgi:myo-inositol-1(or 4)-monophosphatase
MHPMLNIAVRAARKAGSVINRATLDGAGFEVRAKQQNDFVTRVDHAAEEAILEIVRKSYPDHAVLAEESGAAAGVAEYK